MPTGNEFERVDLNGSNATEDYNREEALRQQVASVDAVIQDKEDLDANMGLNKPAPGIGSHPFLRKSTR
jgi:hypothetical protein